MPIPNGLKAIDLLMNIPDGDPTGWYEFMKPLLLDEESRKVFEMRETVWRSARRLVEECSCERGCPSCVGPPVEVGATGKESALVMLRHLVGERG